MAQLQSDMLATNGADVFVDSVLSVQTSLNDTVIDLSQPLDLPTGKNKFTAQLASQSGCVATSEAMGWIEPDQMYVFYTYLNVIKTNNGFRITCNPSGGAGALSFQWYKDGLPLSNNQSINITTMTGTYQVDITDVLNRTITAKIQFGENALNGVTCGARVKVITQITNSIETTVPQLNNSWAWLYTDGQGALWRSDSVAQPAQSNLFITDVDPYEENQSGQPTLQFKVQSQVLLINEQGQTRWLHVTDGHMALPVGD
jgi:hypothetical protein